MGALFVERDKHPMSSAERTAAAERIPDLWWSEGDYSRISNWKIDEEKMPHKHFCDVEGHEWECQGAALRPMRGDTEPSVCMYIRHRVPMEVGDHFDCSIKILACPEHREL